MSCSLFRLSDEIRRNITLLKENFALSSRNNFILFSVEQEKRKNLRQKKERIFCVQEYF